MANKYSFDAEIIAKNQLEVFKIALEDSKNDLKEIEAGSEAISKEIASIDFEILKLVTENNADIEFLQGLYGARLATAADLASYNATYADPEGFDPPDPNTSGTARLFNPNVAWPSGIVATTITVETESVDDDGENVGFSTSGDSYVIAPRSCEIELNENDHGQNVIIDDEGNEGIILVCPVNNQEARGQEYFLEKKKFMARGYDFESSKVGFGITVVEIEITNSSLGVGTVSYFEKERVFLDLGVNSNGQNFTYDGETYSADISPGSSQHTNTISPVLTRIQEREEIIRNYVGFANTARTVREPEDWKILFTKKSIEDIENDVEKYEEILDNQKDNIRNLTDGATGEYSANLLEEIDTINEGILTLSITEDQNYTRSYLIDRNFEGRDSRATGVILDFISSVPNLSITIRYRSTNKKVFKRDETIEFEFIEGDQLETQQVFIPDDDNRISDVDLQVDPETGEILTDEDGNFIDLDGNPINADSFRPTTSSISRVGISTAGIIQVQLFEGDYVTRTSGSIVITDSSGSQSTFSEAVAQIRNIKTGSISTTNIGTGVTISDYEFPTVFGPGISTILSLKINKLHRFNNTSAIGFSSRPFNEIYANRFIGIFSGSVRGDASKIRVSAANTTENVYPTFSIGASSSGISSTFLRVDPNNIFYNPNRNELTAGKFIGLGSFSNLSADTIVSENIVGVFSGTLVGGASSLRVFDGGNLNLINYPVFTEQIGESVARIDQTDLYFRPDVGELYARKLIGIGSFSNIDVAGIATVDSLVISNNLSASGILTIGSDLNIGRNLTVSGVSTFVGNVTFEGGTINLGNADTDDINVSGEFISDLTPNANNNVDLGSSSKQWKNLYLSGNASVLSLNVSGITTINSLNITSDLSATGILTIGSNLNVGGDITASSDLLVSGFTNLNTLNVTGVSTFGSNLDINSNVDISSNLDVNGNTETGTLNVISTGTIPFLTSVNINNSGIITSPTIRSTNIRVTGVSTLTTLKSTTGTINNLDSNKIYSDQILTGIITSRVAISTESYFESLLIDDYSLISNGFSNINPTTDVITINIDPLGRKFNTGDLVKYISDGNGTIGGLVNGSSYYVQVQSKTSIKLYSDSSFTSLVEITKAPQTGIHTFTKEVGISTIKNLKSTQSTINNLISDDINVGFLTSREIYAGLGTFNKLRVEGPNNVRTLSLTNFLYDNNTGISTVVVDGSHELIPGQKIRLSGIAMTCDSYRASIASTIAVTNFEYAASTGISTITLERNHGLGVGRLFSLFDLSFTCSSEHAGVTTTIFPDGTRDNYYEVLSVPSDNKITTKVGISTIIHNYDSGGFLQVGITTNIFPDGTQGFEFVVSKVTGITSFTTNVGVSSFTHTYLSGGKLEIGVNPKYFLPVQDGNSGQTIVTDGAGNLTFGSADRYGGNRIYVSKAFGNDINDGKTAPVRTLRKACQLASAESYQDNVTIFMASGDYEEDNPIIVTDNVSIFGDNLRRVILRPKNPNKDFLRVRNGAYVNGLVFKDAVRFPAITGAREDILRKAGEYAKILVNGETGTATTYRSILPVTSPTVSLGSTSTINDRIDSLIQLTITSISNEKTVPPVSSEGNSDQEYEDAGLLILNNIGSNKLVAGSKYIPGNSVGWATDVSGGNYTLEDITEFEEEVYGILNGIQKDLRYGGVVGNEYTMEEIRNLIVGSPIFTFDFAIAFDDPFDLSVSREGYVGLSSSRPRITLSPYIQNCSIISFLGANGVNVDGSKIVLDNIPLVPEEAENPVVGDIPDQGKSMVANAFTMISFGGIGWKCSNAGYAQIVSCFQIFCEIGSYCQSGGYLSITNSATNFGLYALRSTGFRRKSFEFDRGFVFNTGTRSEAQTLTVGNLQRSDQELYVMKFVRASTNQDETSNFKSTGITTEVSGPAGINTFNSTIFIGAAGTQFSDGDPVIYTSPTIPIPGIINDTTYFITISGIGNTTAKLFFDEALQNRVLFTGGVSPSGIHTFFKSNEEFFVNEIFEKNSTYQDLTLTDSIGLGVTFVIGQNITQTRSDGLAAVGFAATFTDTILTVSVENSTDSAGSPARNLFQNSAAGGGVIFDTNNTSSEILSEESRVDLNTISFVVGSTIPGNEISGITGLPRIYKCHLHRPSIVNSSSHTWEYAGSGTDYNALPENGGQGSVAFEQLSENGGRVFTSGTNELGDFKIGDFITAFNRTGEIQFNNRVTIGQLDALELSLSSGIRITEISASQELGTDEIGGPKNERLITQLAIYSYIQNHLGDFVDATTSTAAIPNSVAQLDSQGKLNEDMIPPTVRFNNVFNTNVAGGRTDFCNDIPAIEILKSDIVTEDTGITTTNYTLVFENEGQFLRLSDNTRNYKFNNNDIVRASQSDAVGIVTVPTHVSYGTTGLVKGTLQSISIGVGGTGYSVSGIYSGVQLISKTGIGTGAEADITVNNGSIENVNLRRGGRYYVTGDILSLNDADVGGTNIGFTSCVFTAGTVHTRLYVDLIENKQQFLASQNVPDFIADSDSVSISTSFSSIYSETFDPRSVGIGGSIFFSSNSILLPPDHQFKDGDPVIYEVTGGLVVSQLVNRVSYFIKTVGVSSVQLCQNYDGTQIIPLDASGTGTHTLKRVGVNTSKNTIVFTNHGFTTGNSIRLLGSDVPSGLAPGGYYFLGSVTTNSFTLHDVRQDALTSSNGATFNEKNLIDSGSGIGTFREQNVTFVDTINTSSNNAANFSILVTSADIDASSIISGIVNPARLATGSPSNLTFLRGDSNWARATQTIVVDSTEEEALRISVPTGKPGGIQVGSGVNTCFGNLALTIAGVTTTGIGVSSFSTKGVGRFQVKNGASVGPFGISTEGSYVTLKSTNGDQNDNGIDAKTFGGVQLSAVVNLTSTTVGAQNYTRGILQSQNGGTSSDNSGATQGEILICSGGGVFQATDNPQIQGGVGIGYFSNLVASGVQKLIDLDQKVSVDAFETADVTLNVPVEIYSFDKTVFRSGKFVIQITDNAANEYHTTECIVIHDGTDAYISEYGSIFTGSELATFDVDVDTDNIRILATPASVNSTTFKIHASSLIRV